MKKMIIASLVGGLILFIWQFLSWAPLNVHTPNLKYTENQDEILKSLENKLEEGSYLLPTVPTDASAEELEQLQKNIMGKPWARISYYNAYSMDMGYNLARGFIIDIFAVWLLTWMLSKFKSLSFMTVMIASLAVGIIGYLSISYLESIWFSTNSIPYLIDTVVSWGAVGAWLGFWLNRN